MKTSRFFIIVMMAVALLTAGCTKEPNQPAGNGDNTPTGLTSLKGTSWMGTWQGSFSGYYTELATTLTFLTETTGELLMEVTVAGQYAGSASDNFTYTYNVGQGGTMTGIQVSQPVNYTYNAADNTITRSVMITLQDQNGTTQTIGGQIVFHQI